MLSFKPQSCFLFIGFSQNGFDIIRKGELPLGLQRCHSDTSKLNGLLHIMVQDEPLSIYLVDDPLDLPIGSSVLTQIFLHAVIDLLG